MWERNISWPPLACSQPGTWPTTQACAQTGTLKGNLSVPMPALNPLSHTSQGNIYFLQDDFYKIAAFHYHTLMLSDNQSIFKFPEHLKTFFFSHLVLIRILVRLTHCNWLLSLTSFSPIGTLSTPFASVSWQFYLLKKPTLWLSLFCIVWISLIAMLVFSTMFFSPLYFP